MTLCVHTLREYLFCNLDFYFFTRKGWYVRKSSLSECCDCMLHNVTGATKPRISKILNVGEPKNMAALAL